MCYYWPTNVENNNQDGEMKLKQSIIGCSRFCKMYGPKGNFIKETRLNTNYPLNVVAKMDDLIVLSSNKIVEHGS